MYRGDDSIMNFFLAAIELGDCLGPPIGSLMYSKYGFSVTVWFFVSLLILVALFVIIVVPKDEQIKDELNESSSDKDEEV